MTDRRDEVRRLFEQMSSVPPAERRAFLEKACRDVEVRRAVEALLDEGPSPAYAATEVLAIRPATGPSLALGTIVNGRYRVERAIGAGGMGAVYRATDLQLERSVAVKVLHGLGSVADASALERFRREALAVARLRHPNIVTLHDYGVAPDVGAYLVMELLEGQSLRAELVVRSRFDAEEAVRLVQQVCRAVGAAHRAGIVHRDLKPENIVVERREGAATVTVVDFGLAKLEAALAPDGVNPTHEDIVLGTPAYTSPEQITGETADARSDVYALGCVLYEALTGRPPFATRPVASLLYRHVYEEPRRPSELVEGIPASLEGVVLRALAKAPVDRYPTMAELDAALGASLGAAHAETYGSDASTDERLPIATVAVDSQPPSLGSLPFTTSRFVGRAGQIGDVARRLGEARLVTLVGPGGIGKTRLSIEAARRIGAALEGGAWFVDLAGLTNPSRVAAAVATALGVREEGDRTDVEAIVDRVRDRRTLVVLDNCEHLVDGCARVAAELLRFCAALRILATSREPLGIPGEAVYPVPALEVPDSGPASSLEAVERFDATALFVERATLRRPDFEATADNATAIAEICRRLDGMPLAIELAAACVRVLAPGEIASRLDDRFRLLTAGNRGALPRHQTLEAALDWSHELISPDERTLLRRLSGFAGGCSLAAAEAVASGRDGLDVVGALGRLVDTSLVVVDERPDGGMRYRLLETVRHYAAAKLRESEDGDAVRAAHLAWCLQLAEDAEPRLTGPEQGVTAARLEEERDNLNAALETSLKDGGDAVLRLCFALGRFWSLHAHLAEGRSWCERALASSSDARHPLRARVALWAAQLARLQGDAAAARAFGDEGYALAVELGDRLEIGAALVERFNIELHTGRLEPARAAAEAAHAIFEALGERRGLGIIQTGLGTLASVHGDYDTAIDWFGRAERTLAEVGDRRSRTAILENLGRVVAGHGELDRGRELVSEALAIARDLGDETTVGSCLHALGLLEAQAGLHDQALERFREALGLFVEQSSMRNVAELLESTASSYVGVGRFRAGALMLGAATEHFERYALERSAPDQQEYDDAGRAIRDALGAEALEAAMAEGRRLSAADAAALAASTE